MTLATLELIRFLREHMVPRMYATGTHELRLAHEAENMAIQPINHEKCIGCGLCVYACPVDVIRMNVNTKKAVALYPEDCMCCALCEDACPEGAIYVSPEKHDPLMVSWR